MEELMGLIIVVGLICVIVVNIVAGKPTPYESYNQAIRQCNGAVEYEKCVVAVNSAYTRMLKVKDEN